MAIVYIGIGSNLGDRKENIETAFLWLKDREIRVIKVSTIIETDPVGGPEGQNKYLNAALKVETSLLPLALLRTLQDIERKLGRIRAVVNGPRPIDLDILLYDDVIMKTSSLIIPHPRMWERNFVMIPLQEIKQGMEE